MVLGARPDPLHERVGIGVQQDDAGQEVSAAPQPVLPPGRGSVGASYRRHPREGVSGTLVQHHHPRARVDSSLDDVSGRRDPARPGGPAHAGDSLDGPGAQDRECRQHTAQQGREIAHLVVLDDDDPRLALEPPGHRGLAGARRPHQLQHHGRAHAHQGQSRFQTATRMADSTASRDCDASTTTALVVAPVGLEDLAVPRPHVCRVLVPPPADSHLGVDAQHHQHVRWCDLRVLPAFGLGQPRGEPGRVVHPVEDPRDPGTVHQLDL